MTYCEHCGLAIHLVAGDIWVHDNPEQPDRPDACFTFDDNPYSATPMTEGT